MAQGTLSKGFPTVYRHDGAEHKASKHIDHERQTEHENLQHIHGPEHAYQTSEPATGLK